jgi:hypothetical protein
MRPTTSILVAALLAGAASAAMAALPPPSPAQAQAAAAKKAAADAQAQKDKEALAASMDRVVARWRGHASAQGRKLNPPVAVASQGAALGAPAAGGKPAQAAPVRSEKAGTAPPSADIKKRPSQPLRR